MKRARAKSGSVVFNKRSKTWHFQWWDNGRRRSKLIGAARDFATKAAACRAAESLRSLAQQMPRGDAATMAGLVAQYRSEKMPERYSTRRSYECWLRKHILPRWGNCPLTDLQARPVELWLQTLPLTPKSKAHIRGLLRILWEYAMWRGDVPTQRNPIELVTIKEASRRMRTPRSLTVEEFHRFVRHLEEPFRTMALICVSFGLRISECLALKWSDIDWLGSKLSVQRGIVRQRVGPVKSSYSCKQMSIDAEMLEVLKAWKQTSQFSVDEDWLFASPTKLGRQPWSYDQVLRCFANAASKEKIDGLGTHSMRHTYRSWLDAVGTPVAVQQKLMRHADIRTTMNVYGDVVTDEMAEAHRKVVGLALNGLQTDCKPI